MRPRGVPRAISSWRAAAHRQRYRATEVGVGRPVAEFVVRTGAALEQQTRDHGVLRDACTTVDGALDDLTPGLNPDP